MASQMLFRFAAGTSRRSRSMMTKTAKPVFRAFSTQPETAFTDHESESFLTGTSSLYAEQMYEQYLAEPSSVQPSWKRYFDNLEEGIAYDENEFNKPTAAASSVKRAFVGVSNKCVSEVV